MRPAAVIGLLAESGPPVYDYYIDATLGDDGNAGTSAAPWKSLSKIVGALSAGNSRTVLVKAGTYSTALDYVEIAPGSISIATELSVTFETGCIMDGTAANAIAPTNGWEASGSAWTLRVYGNGLIVQNYSEATGLSPNGFGNRDTQKMYVYDCHTDNCDDGFSCHDAAQMFTYDCTSQNAEKGEFLHVGTCYVEHHRCTFTMKTGSNGVGSGTPTIKLFDTAVDAVTAGLSVNLAGATVSGGRLGSLTTRVNIVCGAGSTADCSITDTYLHALIEGNSNALFTRCYGRLSTRTRNNAAAGPGIRMRNCVFVDGAAGSSDSLLFASAAFGAQGTWNVEDSVLTGYSTAVGLLFDATYSGYFVTAANYVRNCCMFGNSTNVDPDLTSAGADITGTITGNPLLGAANTYVQADYAVGTGSPCIGAGVSGGNIGFTAADIA